jgi:hypothetical protein
VVQRAITEARARKYTVDVVETNAPRWRSWRARSSSPSSTRPSRRPAGGRGAEAPHVDPRPHELLRRRLQHRESAARGAAEGLPRLPRPEVEGPHRHRGDRRRMDGDAGQEVGRRGGPRAFPQARRAQARRAQRATCCSPS